MVTDLSSTDEGGGVKSRPSPSQRYGDKFEELCGYYMSLGMSYSDFWDGDACMAKHYRQLSEIQKETRNTELWLQAAYIYEALICASPIFNPLSKKGKPFPFRSEPIPITAAGSKVSSERRKKKMLENGKEAMRAMMAAINSQFKKKKEKGGEGENVG